VVDGVCVGGKMWVFWVGEAMATAKEVAGVLRERADKLEQLGDQQMNVILIQSFEHESGCFIVPKAYPDNGVLVTLGLIELAKRELMEEAFVGGGADE